MAFIIDVHITCTFHSFQFSFLSAASQGHVSIPTVPQLNHHPFNLQYTWVLVKIIISKCSLLCLNTTTILTLSKSPPTRKNPTFYQLSVHPPCSLHLCFKPFKKLFKPSLVNKSPDLTAHLFICCNLLSGFTPLKYLEMFCYGKGTI